MKKYFVLYMASEGDFKKAMGEMANITPEQQRASMQEWETWMKSKGGVVEMGAPLGKTKRVTQSDISDIRNEIGGYSINNRGRKPRRSGEEHAGQPSLQDDAGRMD